jgi:hypothetical protein
MGTEDGAFDALADDEVDGPGRSGGEREGHNLATLAKYGQRPVPAFEPECLDVRSSGL